MGNLRTTLGEKVGYGLGDMSSSMFWKIFSYYLPFFYSNIFGLTLDQVALLLVVTRIWDAVSDPMMGVLADRTRTKWGKYRPYLLLMAVPFALSGIFLFSTPAASPTVKLVWAYLTYILMMTVYTGINVPYGAMLGVMTDDSNSKTVMSSFRMFFAYGGSFLALFCWEPLCRILGGYDSPAGWRNAMIVVAAFCLLLFLLCFRMTKEKLHTVSKASVGSDLKSLLRNAPWWILIGAAICSNLFSTVRGSVAAYFFNDVIGQNVNLNLGPFSFLFYAGLFLSIGEVSNMVGVALAVPFSEKFGKKSTYMLSFAALILFSALFFYIPICQGGYFWMLILQVVISIFTGVISPSCLEHVRRCERFRGEPRRHGIHRFDILIRLNGPEIRRCVRWFRRDVASQGVRLQHEPGSGPDSGSHQWIVAADELDSGGRGGHRGHRDLLLSSYQKQDV